MRILKISVSLFMLLFAASTGFGQRVDSILNVLAVQYPVEKVFIHYDKDAYVAGETVWFKAYLTSDGLPSGMSTAFYVQVTDQKGNVIASKTYPVLGAAAKGNIDLPDSLPQGNYYIKAATPSMLNYGPEFIYTRNIYVYSITAATPQAAKTPNDIVLQFFPESGHLVDGILTVVAFKATDRGGKPLDVNGVIRTEDGTTICSFKSYHDGIGKTQFKPQAGKKYHAELEEKDKVLTFPLPGVQPSGVNLKIQDEKGGKMFLLARGGANRAMFSNVTIIAEMNNRVVYETAIEFEDYPSVKGHLLTDSLPSGILHFTVFTNDGIPIVERLSFVNNGEYLGHGEVVTQKINLTKKAENSFDINFPEGMQRSLSVAVTDGRVAGKANNENIWSALLLTEELKGNVYNPSYYFSNHGDSTNVALDNLMLTHGWSRYDWKKLLAYQFPETKYKSSDYLSVTGVVSDDKGPVQGGKLNIYLESEDSSTNNHEIVIGNNGRFAIDSILFYGKTKFYYTYTNTQGKIRPVKVHTDMSEEGFPFDAQFRQAPQVPYSDAIQSSAQVRDQYDWVKGDKERVKVLERVVVHAKSSRKPIEIVNEKYTTGVFRAMGKVNIDNINQPSTEKAGSVLDYIKNRIQQVELVNGRFVSRKNFSLNTGQQWAVDVFLDEIPANAALLRTKRVDDIAMVKYYEAGFVGVGSGSPGGAIAVYTKKEEKEEKPADKLEFFIYNGYSVTREFYKPDYTEGSQALAFPDNRTTLYWDPNVYTDSETKSVNVKFNNNDSGKKLKVVVQGFDVRGKLVYIEKWIE